MSWLKAKFPLYKSRFNIWDWKEIRIFRLKNLFWTFTRIPNIVPAFSKWDSHGDSCGISWTLRQNYLNFHTPIVKIQSMYFLIPCNTSWIKYKNLLEKCRKERWKSLSQMTLKLYTSMMAVVEFLNGAGKIQKVFAIEGAS